MNNCPRSFGGKIQNGDHRDADRTGSGEGHDGPDVGVVAQDVVHEVRVDHRSGRCVVPVVVATHVVQQVGDCLGVCGLKEPNLLSGTFLPW